MQRIRSRNFQPASLRDVAREASVSIMTVSRALHHPDRVSDDTRKRIEEAVHRVGYVPSQIGRSLLTNRTRVLGVLVPSIRNPVFADILQGMSDLLRSEGYQLLLGSTSGLPDEEEGLARAFLAQRPEGLVLHGMTHTAELRRLLSRAGVPVVETGGLEAEPIDMLVGYSNSEAAAMAVRHLVARGYRRIGLVTAPTAFSERAAKRREGYLRVIQEIGLPERPSLMVEARHGYDDWGGEALCQLLAQEPHMDAVFCAGDVWAIGAILECQRRGWTVPGRLAIAGFDDLPIASKVVPPLTTIRIPRYEMGRRAAMLLLDRIQGREPAATVVDVGYSLMKRHSA